MGNKNRAQRRAGKITPTDSKRLAKVLANEQTAAENMIRRYYHGASQPADYLKRALSWRAIQCLPTIIDNYLYYVETVGDIPPANPKLLKLLNEAREAVDRLMNYAYKDHVDTFEQLGYNRKEAMAASDETADVANSICEFIDWFLLYCIEDKDAWRLTQIEKTLTELGPDSVKDEVIKECKTFCENWLDGRHIEFREARAKGIAAKDLPLRLKDDMVAFQLAEHGYLKFEPSYDNAATAIINKK
jgi:hypothetical protein